MKRDWTLGMALCALLCASGFAYGIWVMWTADPVLTLLAGIWAATTGLCVLAATRNLRAELAEAWKLIDAWNSSEARDELAKSPAGGVQKVELYDQDADYHRNEAAAFLFPEHYVHPGSAGQMTVAETDRLIANLQALPDEPFTADVEHSGWHIGQACEDCDRPATTWLSDHTDPDIDDVTFLCDDDYAERMAEEARTCVDDECWAYGQSMATHRHTDDRRPTCD